MEARATRLIPLSDDVRRRLEQQRTRDTLPERRLRSALHRRGLRFRVHRRPIADLRRVADVVFPSARVAIFLDGCFWHGCPDHGLSPKNNAHYWVPKIQRNRERDAETDEALREQGWVVTRVWEHEDVDAVAADVAKLVRRRVGRKR